MARIISRHFEADGDAYNTILGGVPNIAIVVNLNAVTTEDAILVWLKDLEGEIQITAQGAFSFDSATGSLSEYEGNSIDSGTSNDDDDPVKVEGGAGLTIATGFMDDGDEIVVIAFFTDIDDDLGDIA
jgi:hypothetical protein